MSQGVQLSLARCDKDPIMAEPVHRPPMFLGLIAAAFSWALAVPSLAADRSVNAHTAAPQPPTRADADFAVAEVALARGDIARAVKLYDALAHQGFPLAQFNLAVLLSQGDAPDRPGALLLLHTAAAHGYAPAMYALGQAFEYGLLGTRDLAQSTRWYEQAAGLGDNEAALSAGLAYYMGRGAPQDMTIAAGYLLQAARAGDVAAQYIYARMCETGDGVAQDLRIAAYWYQAAAKNGDVGAAIKARELADH